MASLCSLPAAVHFICSVENEPLSHTILDIWSPQNLAQTYDVVCSELMWQLRS